MSLELIDFALCHFYISLRKRPLSDYIDSIIFNLHHKPSTLKKKNTTRIRSTTYLTKVDDRTNGM